MKRLGTSSIVCRIDRARAHGRNAARGIRRGARRWLGLLAMSVALAAGGCSTVLPERGEPVAPQDYRKLVAEKIPDFFAKPVYVGGLEISPLRREEHYLAADWSACLKAYLDGRTRLFAVYFRDDKIVEMSGAVQIDACKKETFEPLNIPPQPKKPPELEKAAPKKTAN